MFFVENIVSVLSSVFSGIILNGSSEMIRVLLTAVAMDLLIGEPPAAVHPVVWFGKIIAFLKRHAPASHRKAYGIFMSLLTVGSGIALALAVLILTNADVVPAVARILVQAYFLKATFAVRCMVTPAHEICSILDDKAGDIEKVRSEMKTYVSRDTSKLSRSQIISGVIESVSENYVDSILSPILFYVVFGPFGLVAAYIFKGFSTLDSMIGYLNDECRELGWFAAKSDDVLNWIPARLSHYLIACGAAISNAFPVKKEYRGFAPGKAVSCAQAEHRASPSPNSGWPMAAAAGTLDVRLEKPGVYVINDSGKTPETTDIMRVSVLIVLTSLLTVFICALFLGILNIILGQR